LIVFSNPFPVEISALVAPAHARGRNPTQAAIKHGQRLPNAAPVDRTTTLRCEEEFLAKLGDLRADA